MRKLTLPALLLLLLLMPASAQALEIKNVRAIYGPFGSPRPETKFLPGDTLLISFTIAGIKVEPASGVVRYESTMEILDSAKKTIFKKTTPVELIATLGGDQIPGQATVTMGANQAPGMYQVKVIIADKSTKDSKDSKEFIYNFELLPKAFGFIQAAAPSVGLVGQDTAFGVTLVGWDRDSKKLPNIEVVTRITDEAGKSTLAKPLSVNLPKDLPEDLIKEGILNNDFLQLPLPVYLNRAGRFLVEVEAIDNVSKKSAKMKFSINVIDVGTAGK